MIDLTALCAPFSPASVSWRVGSTNREKTSGMALAYIDARDVMNRLDDVCGPAGWGCEYTHADRKTICEIRILCGDTWVAKANGAGDSDIEAEKGAISDAFKRAAVMWGIGRYLYDIDSPWVAIEPFGKSFKIKDSEKPKLVALLARHAAGEKKAPPSPPPPRPLPAAVQRQDRQAQVQEAQRDGLTQAPPATAQPAAPLGKRAAAVKERTDKRIADLNTGTWAKETLGNFWKENTEWIEWMADAENGFTEDYDRFIVAYNNAETTIRKVA